MNRRELLKSATADAHRWVDEASGRLDLSRFRDYRRFLSAIAAALLPLENLLEANDVERLFPDWRWRRRSLVLQLDLAIVGLPITFSPLLQRFKSTAQLYGIVYVLEGSRLGARALAPRALASSDARVRGAARYLRAHRGEHWRSFLAQLESAPEAADVDNVVSGARQAFALYVAAFTGLAGAELDASNLSRTG